MKYAMLIYPKPGSEEALGEAERNSVSAEYLALRDDPRCVGGAHLQPAEMATTVRAGGGENLITDPSGSEPVFHLRACASSGRRFGRL
jgi:hypothetical protein